MLDHSEIHGREVYLDAPNAQLMVDGTSSVNADGGSAISKGKDKMNGQGASYIGQGGYCGKAFEDLTYGKFDGLPNTKNIYDLKGWTQIGSRGMSKPYDIDTMGGGRVHINVDSVNLLDQAGVQISANGLPLEKSDEKDDLNGGTGGYIYIKTSEKYQKNKDEGQIQAVGGFGKNQGLGGAGG